MDKLLAFLFEHIVFIAGIVAYVVIAAVNALPDPAAQKFEVYPWIYHTAKSLMNAVPPQYKSKLNP